MPYACGALCGTLSARAKNVRSTPICVVGFSSFDFASALASEEGKSKCAKLGIAKTGFSKPKKRGGKILNSFPEM